MPRDEAGQAKQQAAEAADDAAKSMSRVALLSSLAVILGDIAAWFRGRAGTVDSTVTAHLVPEERVRNAPAQ